MSCLPLLAPDIAPPLSIYLEMGSNSDWTGYAFTDITLVVEGRPIQKPRNPFLPCHYKGKIQTPPITNVKAYNKLTLQIYLSQPHKLFSSFLRFNFIKKNIFNSRATHKAIQLPIVLHLHDKINFSDLLALPYLNLV